MVTLKLREERRLNGERWDYFVSQCLPVDRYAYLSVLRWEY